MKYVEPIRDRSIADNIANYLLKTSKRDCIMFLLGVNVGLRISDILQLRVKDIKNKDQLNVIEQKTGKPRPYKIPIKFNKNILQPYLKPFDDNYEYIFKSRQGMNKPISRTRAWQIMSKAASHFGIDHIGTHTLRKTFGYHHYKQFHNVVYLMKIFNHAAEEITLRYIGVMSEEVERSTEQYDFMSDFKIN